MLINTKNVLISIDKYGIFIILFNDVFDFSFLPNGDIKFNNWKLKAEYPLITNLLTN